MFTCTKYYDGTFDQDKFDKTLLASKDQDGLMSKEDKAKLDEMSGGATSSEPSTVNAFDVVEDSTHRFVTDDEKTIWNNQISRDVLGTAGGVATLDESGLIPTSQLPGFVDDIIEDTSVDNFPQPGEAGKLYVDTTSNKTYRWSGTQYTPIVTDGLALGETSATAFAGDKGKAVTEIANAIMNGTSVVPKATNAEMVNGYTLGTNVPADAVFTDTIYTHPETHNAEMIVESDDKKFATAAQLAKVDSIPEDPKYTDTVYIHPETHDVEMIVESNDKKFATAAQLAKVDSIPEDAVFTDTIYTHPETHNAEMIVESNDKKFATAAQLEKLDAMPKFVYAPYFDETDKTLYACGVPVTIKTSTNEGKAICEYVHEGKKSFEFPSGQDIKIHGGGNGKVDTPFYPATCITLNSGSFDSIVAGNAGGGAVGTGTIIINGGSVNYIEASRASIVKEYDNIVGHLNIVINNTDSAITCIYGGAQGLGTVGHVRLTMNGGTAQWVTAGGSNGYTAEAEVVINGGTITVLQGCNRGAVGNIKVTINGGTIQRVYAGGETEDSGVTATYKKSELFLNGGTLGSVTSGTNGGVVSAVNVSGTYVEGVLTPEAAVAMNLTKAFMKFTDIVIEDGNLVFKNGDTVVKSLTLA